MFKRRYAPTVVILGHGVEKMQLAADLLSQDGGNDTSEPLDISLQASLVNFKNLTLSNSNNLPVDVTQVINQSIDRLRHILDNVTRDKLGSQYETRLSGIIKNVLPTAVDNYLNLAEHYKTPDTHRILLDQCKDILTQIEEIIEHSEQQTLHTFQSHAKYVKSSTEQMAIEKEERDHFNTVLPNLLNQQENEVS